jgi:membrane protein
MRAVWERTKHFTVRLYEAWRDDHASRLAAAIAYHTVFALAPLTLVAVAIAGLVYGQEAAAGQLASQLESVVGPQVAELTQTAVANASATRSGIIATVIAVVVIIYGSARAFLQLQGALNYVWLVKIAEGTPWWRVALSRLLPFAMVVIMGALLLASVALTSVFAWLSTSLSDTGLPYSATTVDLFATLVWFAGSIGLFYLLFRFLPDARAPRRSCVYGAIVISVLFGMGRYGISFYLSRATAVDVYGTAGSIVVLLLWVYFSTTIVLIGAEVIQVHAEMTGGDIRPQGYAVRTRRDVRAEEG